MKKIYIIKANGQSVPFDPNKVIGTCRRAGASNKMAKRIAKKTMKMVRNGMSTKDIYRIVLRNISEIDEGRAIKHKYRLKESIMRMGPAGFPFESYVSQILSHYGYKVEAVRKAVNGKCVTHEIDVIARLNNKRYMVECKYHHNRGIYTSLKDSLYTHARFLDLSNQFDQEILSCNTKLSVDALTYAKCVGQNILCWRHPQDEGLEKMIDEKGLYPITILSLNKMELMAFSKINFMIAKETGGIILIKDDIMDVARAVKLSRATMRKIKQNLFWALAYNTGAIPIAAIGLLSPIIAAAAMALSSISVIANSSLLKRFKITNVEKNIPFMEYKAKMKDTEKEGLKIVR